MGTVHALLHKPANILWDDSEHRRLKDTLHFVNSLDAGIQILNEKRKAKAHNQSQKCTQADVEDFIGFHRELAGCAGIDDRYQGAFGNGRVSLDVINPGSEKLVQLPFILEFLL